MRLPLGLNIIDNELVLSNWKVSTLQKVFGTPLYLFSEKELEKNIAIFNENFKGEFTPQIVYASKAFLVPKMCEYVKKNNWMMDAVSLGDLYVIKKYMSLKNVVFHGNNKSLEELIYAVKNKVGIIVIDSLEELQVLYTLVENSKYQVNTMVRINPHVEAHTHKYITTSSVDSKFGEPIENIARIERMIEIYKKSKNLKLLGFHSHIGSQILESKPFIENAVKMIEFTNLINEKFNLELSELNLGGGFGVNYTDENPSLENILKELSFSLSTLLKTSKIKKVYIEPGRSIVAESGMTLYTASYTKKMPSGTTYLMVDGGMTDNIRPALYQAKYTVLNGNHVLSQEQVKANVVGKCCESGDIIAEDVNIKAEFGDPILVLSTGAYGYSMKFNYNNALSAPVILVGDKISVLAKREKLKDLTKLF